MKKSNANVFLTVYKLSLASQGFLSVVYALTLLGVSLTFLYLKWFYQDLSESTASFVELVNLVMISTTVLISFVMAVKLFSFVYESGKTDFFHALPISREALFMSKFFAGLTLLLVPLIIYAIASMFIFASTEINVWDMFIHSFVCALSAFSFTTFIVVCCGNIFSVVMTSMVLNVMPSLILSTLSIMTSSIVPGYDLQNMLDTKLMILFSPFLSFFFVDPFYNFTETFSAFTAWWIIFSLLVFMIAISIYRKRKSEVIGEGVYFKSVFVIVKVLVSVGMCFLLGVGLMITLLDPFYFFVGVAIGSIITFFVMKTICCRGLKRKTLDFKRYIFSIGIMCLTYIIIITGVFGYDRRKPLFTDIENVELSCSDDLNPMFSITSDGFNVDKEYEEVVPVLDDEHSIELSLDLHSKIVDNILKQFPYRVKSKQEKKVDIKYKLKNGKTINRAYDEGELDEIALGRLYDIFDSEVYKKKYDVLFKISSKDIKGMDINYYVDNNVMREIEVGQELSITQKQKVLDALKEDMLEDTVQKRLKWRESNDNNYVSITFKSYESEYDNPDMKNILFYDGGHIVPSYYKRTNDCLKEGDFLI